MNNKKELIAQGTIEEFFGKKFNKKSIAQGTIEYLVIIAIVVVISLIAVGLFISLSSSPSQQIKDSSSKLDNVSSGGINIVEAITDLDGDSLIKLSNRSSDNIILTRISVGGVDNNFSEQLVGLDSKVFSLRSLNSNCPCEEGQKNVECELRMIYTASSGILKTENRTISFDCVTDSIPVNASTVVAPIVLSTNCFDIDDNPISICSLSDLNRVREKLNGNYVLTTNIDASETREWRNGLGWDAIGVYDVSDTSYFTGTFDGQEHIISNLYVNEANLYAGLFDYTRGDFNNLILTDVNINKASGNYAGSITAYLGSGGSITNSYVTGRVQGEAYVGGLAGAISGSIINNSYFSGIATAGAGNNVGGLVGYISGSGNIHNSYSLGTVSGGNPVGGLIGYISSGAISNSYSNSSVSGANVIGGFVGQMDGGTIKNSYSTGTVIASFPIKGGFAGSKPGGTITNCGWWNGAGPTYAIGSTSGPVTYSESNVSAYYNPTHNVYDSNVPYWTFGTDANWVATATYPILSWQ